MIIALCLGAAWIVCGVIAYGVMVATLQAIWLEPEWAQERLGAHRRFAFVMSLLGPFALMAVYGDFGKGWKA